MKKRSIALLCAIMITGSLVTGCGGNTADNTQTGNVNTEQANGEQPRGEQPGNDRNMTMGKVTEINGNEITIALVKMNGGPGNGEMPEGENGERPEMPEGETGGRPEMPEGENGERPEMPEGENGERPEMPEGENGERPEMPGGENGEKPEMPEGEEGKMPEMSEDMLEETGETKTITIEDESILVKNEGGEQTSISLADIKVGDIVSLVYDENETLTQVMIGFGGGRNK